VILDDTMQPGSFLFVRTLIAKKLRLRSIMQLVKPRVFSSSDAKQARRNYQTGNLSQGSASDTETFFSDRERGTNFARNAALLLTHDAPETVAQLLPLPDSEPETEEQEATATDATEHEADAEAAEAAADEADAAAAEAAADEADAVAAEAAADEADAASAEAAADEADAAAAEAAVDDADAAAAEATADESDAALEAETDGVADTVTVAALGDSAVDLIASTMPKPRPRQRVAVIESATATPATPNLPVLASARFGPEYIRKLKQQIQDNVDFQLDSSEGLLFVQLSLLREYTVTSIRLEAKVEALQKDVTGLRAAMHQMSSILHPQAETPQVSGFEVIDSWDDYIDFVEASEQRLSALRTHLRLFRRVKWQDSVRDMLDNILSLRMQAVVNFKGTDMRERALKAGVSTQLSIDDLGFKMAFLPYIQ
uniref:DHC_N1 domain-containing protein n=1 Tax=Macrostomum lignano TaxID=282301 RepID=A0A1I8G447_9PLAT